MLIYIVENAAFYLQRTPAQGALNPIGPKYYYFPQDSFSVWGRCYRVNLLIVLLMLLTIRKLHRIFSDCKLNFKDFKFSAPALWNEREAC